MPSDKLLEQRIEEILTGVCVSPASRSLLVERLSTFFAAEMEAQREAAYTKGFDDGYGDGVGDGKVEGYDNGYQDGLEIGWDE